MRCGTRRMRSTVGCRTWNRAEWLCTDRQRVFECATRLQSYARMGSRGTIFGRLYGLRGPASRLGHPAEVVLALESWRVDVHELVPRAREADGTTVSRQAQCRAQHPTVLSRRNTSAFDQRPTRRPLEGLAGEPSLGRNEFFFSTLGERALRKKQ